MLSTLMRLTPEILHDLQGRQHIGGIAAEPRQFEHQNVGNTIFS